MSRRLAGLEERTRETTEDEEGRISQQALRRVTTEDLRLLTACFKRAIEEGGEPTEEEEAALDRYGAFREEVRREHA